MKRHASMNRIYRLVWIPVAEIARGRSKGSSRKLFAAANGGSVALIGNSVSNQGTITAQLGTVALSAGNAVTLTFNGNNLV